MPTDTSRGWIHARSFALRALAWSLGLFGLLRLNWVETQWLLPLTRLQARFAVGLCGTPSLPIDATLACSGADALALCVGAIFSYPVCWRTRLAGAGGGLTLLLGLNILRIGTLGRAAASPAWFGMLHLYLWPAALALAVALYVFGWMRAADGAAPVGSRPRALLADGAAPVDASSPARLAPRFIVLAVALLLLFTAGSPLYLESVGVLAVAAVIASAAAASLQAFGIEARAAANVLLTPRGGFAVTQMCVCTPLIPIYLAAVLACATTWRQRAVGLIATVPLFVGLGIARLLVVALPAALVASPIYLIHAFYQLLLAVVVVTAAAFWRHDAVGPSLRPALTGLVAGVASALLLGPSYAHVLARAAGVIVAGAPLDDPQGAVALLPAFQVGLYVALWVAAFVAAGRRRFLSGLAVLALVQIATLVTLSALAGRFRLAPQVRDVRAWAVLGPLLVVVAVVNVDRLLRRPARAAGVAGGGPGG